MLRYQTAYAIHCATAIPDGVIFIPNGSTALSYSLSGLLRIYLQSSGGGMRSIVIGVPSPIYIGYVDTSYSWILQLCEDWTRGWTRLAAVATATVFRRLAVRLVYILYITLLVRDTYG